MPEERQALRRLLDWGFVDAFRYLYPNKVEFTWWDYIGGAIWKNQGMRIDYIFITEPLLEEPKRCACGYVGKKEETAKALRPCTRCGSL
jgi:exodeoxyribonuclease-3